MRVDHGMMGEDDSLITLGTLQISRTAALAPMAGIADRAMRELCMEYGAAFAVGELASARGICLSDRKSTELLFVSPQERPMGVQLFGGEPGIMADAAKRAMEFAPDFIDINMGCPAPKVAGNGGGSALMKDPILAASIVKAVVRAVDVPVTFKIRAGWDSEHLNAVELALRCEDAGAAMCTVHGRTREQRYAPPVNLDIIRDVKQALSIPVIGNGDITSPQGAAAMLKYTGCDMIMVGRAAAGAPWIFGQITEYLRTGRLLPCPPLEERMAVLRRQVGRMIEYKGETIAMLQARKQASFYMRGIRGAARLRTLCGSMRCMGDLDALINEVLACGEGDPSAAE